MVVGLYILYTLPLTLHNMDAGTDAHVPLPITNYVGNVIMN